MALPCFRTQCLVVVYQKIIFLKSKIKACYIFIWDFIQGTVCIFYSSGMYLFFQYMGSLSNGA